VSVVQRSSIGEGAPAAASENIWPASADKDWLDAEIQPVRSGFAGAAVKV